MEESVFAKIVAGEIPCHKVFEDEHTLAFLDMYPKNEGHTLIIPKTRPTEFVWDLDDEVYQAVMATAKKVADRQKQVLPYPYIHMAVVGTDVPYAHVHVIPFTTTTDLHARHQNEPDDEFFAQIAKKLAF